MNKITYEQLNECLCEASCANGLKVVIWHKPDFNTTMCLMGTHFGSLDYQLKDKDGKIHVLKKGIAHFLEHKMFESLEGEDIMNQFSQLGANVNAFTSYYETVYYFTTTQSQIETELSLLLDFTQSLNITNASVEKEKDIIVQELKMYLENADQRLMHETYRSMYHTFPLRNDIGGDEESVRSITKEDLIWTYQQNYHPSRMTLVVVTPIHPQIILNIVEKNQSAKSFDKYEPVLTVFDEEPQSVLSKHSHITMDVSSQKCCIGFKMPPLNFQSDLEIRKQFWIMEIVCYGFFSSINPLYEKWLQSNCISHDFSFSNDLSCEYQYLMLMDNVKSFQKFEKFVFDILKMLKTSGISKEIVNRLKIKLTSELVRIFDNPEHLAQRYFMNLGKGISIIQDIEIIKNITHEECMNYIASLDFENYSIVTLSQ